MIITPLINNVEKDYLKEYFKEKEKLTKEIDLIEEDYKISREIKDKYSLFIRLSIIIIIMTYIISLN